MFSLRKRRSGHVDIWAGFVDALSTLLMVIIFVLMTFVISQFYMSDVLNTRDSDLKTLNQKIQNLSSLFNKEKIAHEETKKQIDSYQNAVAQLENELNRFRNELLDAKKVSEIEETQSLVQHLQHLKSQLLSLTQALAQEQRLTDDQTKEIENIKDQMDKALLSKDDHIKQLEDQINFQQEENVNLQKLMEQHKAERAITQYRSEFFEHLKRAIGDRQDMKVVGDRFVFQSEVLFERGSAELEKGGKEQLKQFSKVLKEIAEKIPSHVEWILRVDGHTDVIPIKTAQFASNWELSTARAIAVVKFLTHEGISPQHLVAAGFGEFQPLVKDEEGMSRNRRIEFKLDQK